MQPRVRPVSSLLHEAAETHHTVYRIVDGVDDDWASWYADWLINLSELSEALGTRPVRSELIYMLVKLDKDYMQEKGSGEASMAPPMGKEAPDGGWEEYYAGRLEEHFR